MATYKKRGHKPKGKEEKQAALEDQSTTAEVFNTLDQGASRTEEWVERNQKYIYILVGIIALGALGYLAYQEFIHKPKELEAANEMYQAQSYFEQALGGAQQDSLFRLSLSGGEGKYGFLDIIDNYGSTDAGNQARYYAGIAYFNLKDYKEAISHLDKFDAGDNILGPIAKGTIGDAFVQLNQKEDALSEYKKASDLNANAFTSPKFLLKAAIIALQLENAEEALTHLNKIKIEYPESPEAEQTDALIAKAEAMQ